MNSADDNESIDHDPIHRPHDEERINAFTHGLGIVLSLLGAVAMYMLPAEIPPGQGVACGVFLASLVAVYSASTMSHWERRPEQKQFWRSVDQGVIYLLIAGTYTPLMWAFLPSRLRWIALTLMWGAALAGKMLKVFGQYRVQNISTITYLLLGWVPAMFFGSYAPLACLAWMAAGGIAYSVGVVFLLMDRRHAYFHAIWHLLVITGSACHWWAIYHFTLAAQS